MIYNNVVLKVKDSKDIGRVAELLRQAAVVSRQEAGCERFEVHHSSNDSQVFLLIESWRDEQALADHRNSIQFTQSYQPNVLPLVEREAHLCDLL
ncbi:MAG: antibiotic biosynthesis monooxygenase [Gammaproteobacteria bacterium TMED134]|nr:MAG: antibiotic biosynthesis monooxygenase [Gammaproteobacteria bacterium TMED134]HCD28253.1 antibiotic biosynthesis monooxygenase [Gammaproteobacteria bacterium]